MNAKPAALLFASASLVLLCAGCPVPMSVDPDATTDVDSSDEGTPVTCPASHGPTMHEGSIGSDEVWSAEGSPHVVAKDIGIYASVTVEACATVQIGAGRTITIGDGGSLHADGAADDGVVTFERLDPDAAWSTIRLSGGTMALEHAILDGGGDPLNTLPYLHGAVIAFAHDDETIADPVLLVRDVEIRGSASQGIRLDQHGAFDPDSENLVIVDSAEHPISAEVDNADAIPTGEYTGNGDDRILLTVVYPVGHDMTLAERGVPYLVGVPGQIPDFRVFAQDEELATLTIEAGVELQFGAGGALRIEPAAGSDIPATGALVAIGTDVAPIVFTSAADEPAAGDWLGLMFGGLPASNDRLDHVRVEYAGGTTNWGSASCPYDDGHPNNEAAIRVLGVPPGQFITETTVVASARHGIDRGWRADVVVDFAPTNDLEDVAACRQSVSSAATGACPDPVPCE